MSIGWASWSLRGTIIDLPDCARRFETATSWRTETFGAGDAVWGAAHGLRTTSRDRENCYTLPERATADAFMTEIFRIRGTRKCLGSVPPSGYVPRTAGVSPGWLEFSRDDGRAGSVVLAAR